MFQTVKPMLLDHLCWLELLLYKHECPPVVVVCPKILEVNKLLQSSTTHPVGAFRFRFLLQISLQLWDAHLQGDSTSFSKPQSLIWRIVIISEQQVGH